MPPSLQRSDHHLDLSTVFYRQPASLQPDLRTTHNTNHPDLLPTLNPQRLSSLPDLATHHNTTTPLDYYSQHHTYNTTTPGLTWPFVLYYRPHITPPTTGDIPLCAWSLACSCLHTQSIHSPDIATALNHYSININTLINTTNHTYVYSHLASLTILRTRRFPSDQRHLDSLSPHHSDPHNGTDPTATLYRPCSASTTCLRATGPTP